ncbi:transporter [Pectobacterium sp. B2J-2]|uniref:transporter n=1 Tax=Pectobacterium sp. B2J-2 TaxID=3385372 RepID=UPI0038FCD2C5
MTTRVFLWRRYIPLAGAGMLFFQSAQAMDLDALDLIPAPDGTTAIVNYLTFNTRGSYKPVGSDYVKNDTGLNSIVGTFRYVHYMDIGGYTVAPQILLPFGGLYDGKLAGAKLKSTSGLSDPIVALPVWLVNNKDAGTTFALVPYLYIPFGNYDAGETLNMGENRWKFDFQVGGTQRIADNVVLQASFDTIWYGDNNDAISRGQGTLSQDNSYQAQLWLSYIPPEDKTWNFAVGYAKNWGGTQYQDGVANGAATRSNQVRLEISKFVQPTLQIQWLVQKETSVDGSYKSDFSTTVRLMKLF